MRPSARRCLRCSPALRTTRAIARLRDSPLSRYITLSEEVKDALHRSLPVVSLETAITSHGLPFEQAISTAKSLDQIIRVNGAVPAVVGLIDGKIKIGLDESEIKRLADPESRFKKWKVGKRDIAPAIVNKVDGGTTVSATSFLSHLAGIDVFVTGGIGGVHRGAQQTMDISSDLTELGRTPTTVVCAGAKSILDIGLTLEYLETLGVTVTTFGHTTDFPAFYARKSGFQAPSNVTTAREAAELIYYSKLLKTKTGTLIGVPIPEKYEEKSKRIQEAVEQAVRESEENGIATRGKEVTPWILAKVKELSGGESVESNIALIENNARVGTGIAVELSRLIENNGENESSIQVPSTFASSGSSSATEPNEPLHKRLVVLGAAAVDIVSAPAQLDKNGKWWGQSKGLVAKTTVPGTTAIRLGGVARNVHEAAFKTGAKDAVLIAPIGKGNDPLAKILRDGLAQLGACQEGLIEMDGPTPSVNMILERNGTLEVGVAATELVEEMSWDQIKPILDRLKPGIVCFDGNISSNTMIELENYSFKNKIELVFEPTSDAKACKILKDHMLNIKFWPPLKHFAPNVQELLAFSMAAEKEYPASLTVDRVGPLNEDAGYSPGVLRAHMPDWASRQNMLNSAVLALAFSEFVWVKGGAEGLCVFSRADANQSLEGGSGAWLMGTITDPWRAGPCKVIARWYKPLEVDQIVNSIGAGDSMLGAVLAGLSKGMSAEDDTHLDKLVDIGQLAAIASLQSETAVGDLTEVKGYLDDQDFNPDKSEYAALDALNQKLNHDQPKGVDGMQ